MFRAKGESSAFISADSSKQSVKIRQLVKISWSSDCLGRTWVGNDASFFSVVDSFTHWIHIRLSFPRSQLLFTKVMSLGARHPRLCFVHIFAKSTKTHALKILFTIGEVLYSDSSALITIQLYEYFDPLTQIKCIYTLPKGHKTFSRRLKYVWTWILTDFTNKICDTDVGMITTFCFDGKGDC